MHLFFFDGFYGGELYVEIDVGNVDAVGRDGLVVVF